MALFMKQDFSPAVLSRKWIAMKFRPNMLIYSREHIISILESGLLFREDSIEVEQEAPCPEVAWARAGGSAGGWLTKGERNLMVVAVAGFLLVSPPRNIHRSTLLKLSAYALLPLLIRASHRSYCRGELVSLLTLMRQYTALARRAAACCREHAVVGVALESVSSTVSSTQALLCRQQAGLARLMGRAASAVLGSAPWLRGDVPLAGGDTLVKIHHAFLVVQSTLLKYIALAHFMPSLHCRELYRNHNERIHWLHGTLIRHILLEFRENYDSLERMYRLLKNYGSRDSVSAVKKPGSVISSWLYSDVHTGIARTCMEMKVALDKATHLDMFLDSCALNKQTLDLDVLDRDIDEVIDNITKCLSAVQNSQIRLRKMQNKLCEDVKKEREEEIEVNEGAIVQIEDKEPEIRDEVFYYVKTEDERSKSPAGDITTAPGQKERENSRVVLKELKRKLGKREDMMRERERQALAKTMPELKVIPEFPRQIKYEEFIDKKGFITKLAIGRKIKKCTLQKVHKDIKYNRMADFEIKINKTDLINMLGDEDVITKFDDELITIRRIRKKYFVSQRRCVKLNISNDSSLSDCVSVGTDGTEDREDREENLEDKYRVSREELESSDSDFGNDKVALLNDVRRHRVMRKKNFPKRPSMDNVDEGLKPIEYSFGTGMAMASVLQMNKIRENMLQEEVFIGDGEVSDDSGNDGDE